MLISELEEDTLGDGDGSQVEVIVTTIDLVPPLEILTDGENDGEPL